MRRLRAAGRALSAPVASVRVAAWAWSQSRRLGRELRAGGIDTLADISQSPAVGASHRATVAAVLGLAGATCLVRSAVLQRWDADHGRPRPLLVGVARNDGGTVEAHAWLDGEGSGQGFIELHRRPPPRR
jgi:hypothetical protein